MLKIIGGQRVPPSIVIPTPSFGLNLVLGGGIWSNRITTLWGNPQCGKTTFALHTMAEAQELGFVPVIIDAEGSYTDEWAEQCGIDLKTRVYLKSTVVEDILREIVPMMASGHKYIFLMDSINGFVFENFNKEADGGQAIGQSARAQKYFTLKVANYIHSDMAMIYIAQQSIGFQGTTAFLQANLSNAVRHWSTNIIKLFASSSKDSMEREKDTELITGQEVTWTIEKSKQNPCTGTKGHYWFHPQDAQINQKEEIINMAVKAGLIKKGGAWYTVGDKQYQGMPKLLAGISDDELAQLKAVLTVSDLEIED